MSKENKNEEELTYSEERKAKASKKRHKEEKTFSIMAVIIYSIILLLVASGAYVGVKFGLSYFNKKHEAALLEAQQKEEEEKRAAEEAAKEEEPVETVEEEKEEENSDEWEDLVFSKIENIEDPANALVNTFDFSRIEVENEFGKVLTYSVFTNPENGQVEKIETSENCGDLFEIIDYYYADGKINYIAEFSQAVDLPVNIASADIQSRYYYTNDKLVKYIYCEDGKGIQYSLEDKDKYSSGVIEQLEYTSNEMLNKANKTWEDVKSGKQQAYIEGYVLDEYNTVLADRPVKLIEENTGRIAQETKTNGDGKYSFTVIPNELKAYTIRAELTESDFTDVYGVKIPKGTKTYSVPNIYLCYPAQTIPFTVQIFVKDANDANIPLDYADIRFRYGLNARTGEAFMTGNLGEFGYIAPQLRSGNYTCEVNKEGYETLYFNLVVKVDHTAVVEYAVKELTEGDIKAVLSWEVNPLDLDLKCLSSNQACLYTSYIDSVGSVNAEVVDLQEAGTDAYSFYVSDFTNIAIDNYMGYSLTESIAVLSVYNSEGLIGNYYVPAAHAGAVWKPIEIRNGKVIPINDYFLGLGQDIIFKTKK